MPFPYKTPLIFGATSGIGAALAQHLFPYCKTVILTGRREANLAGICKDVPNAHYRVHDLSDLDSIPHFAEKVLKDFPEIDCVILNSGIQRGFDFSHPETVDLEEVGKELETNYLSYLHVLKYFLPHLMKQEHAAVVAMGSGLALVPLARCPNYGGSKAALHQFWLALREQLKGTSVRVVEIFPPSVQTELHDAKHQPDIKDGHAIGMPLKEFIEETWAGLERGDEEIAVGGAKTVYEEVERPRQRAMKKLAERGTM